MGGEPFRNSGFAEVTLIRKSPNIIWLFAHLFVTLSLGRVLLVRFAALLPMRLVLYGLPETAF